jgi:retinol dehydrogenase 14
MVSMAQQIHTLTDKVILVTGATDGIGKETARELAAYGAKVIIHARTPERGIATMQEMLKEQPTLDLTMAVADFGSLASVRTMADEITARFPRLDVLVNNAGVITSQRQLSTDGYELTFAVNHLAHFLLTNLLLDALKAASSARIITVSSNVHRASQIDFTDLNMTQRWDSHAAYGQSKIANVLFAYRLADMLKESSITSNALHPGIINTKMLQRGFGFDGGESVKQGAATSVFLATDPHVGDITGKYFDNCQPVRSSSLTYDRSLQERLWEISVSLVGL